MPDELKLQWPLKNLAIRWADKHGCGLWGAPRGTRRHHGLDLLALVGEAVLSPVTGRVNRVGIAYSDTDYYKILDIIPAGLDGYLVRIFYASPNHAFAPGAKVLAGDVIGSAQDIGARYPGIMNHIHLEVVTPDGGSMDPMALFTWPPKEFN